MVTVSSVGRPAGVRAAFVVLLVVLLASVGVFLLLQRWPDTGAALTTPVAPVVMTVPLGATKTDTPVTVTVSTTRPAPLVAPALSGVVTAVDVAPGDVLGQGEQVLEVNGHPVRAAATAKPFYRVIHLGDVGDDVIALRTLLRDVGVGVAASGAADQALRIAVGSWLGSQPDGVIFDPAGVIWLPTAGLVVGTVAATVGAPAPAAGTAVVTFAPVVQSATVPTSGFTADAGGFTVAVAGRSIPVDLHGVLTLSEEDARALAATAVATPPGPDSSGAGGDPAADAVVVGDAQGTLTTTWASPVVTIPTSAIITREDGTLCVVTVDGAADRGVTVTVTASQTDTGTSQALGLAAGASLVVNPVASATAVACTHR